MKCETPVRLSREGQINSGNLLKMFATKRQKGILNRRAHAQSTWQSPKKNEGKATKAARNKSASAASNLDGKPSVVWNLLPSLAASWPLGVSFLYLQPLRLLRVSCCSCGLSGRLESPSFTCSHSAAWSPLSELAASRLLGISLIGFNLKF